MLIQYHEFITREALSEHFSSRALEFVLAANLKQDGLLTGQIGHDEYHYDNNAFDKADRYLEEQRLLTLSALREDDLPAAWAAFGRLTHAAQDFYAHSNYVDLWLARANVQSHPSLSEIDPLIEELIHSSDLHSGALYYPLEILAFIPVVKRFVIPLLLKDSHAHMNLDSPAQGERFAYAYAAAVKRTKLEFERTIVGFSVDQVSRFRGQERGNTN